MATKVKGITIELSADASGIETALKDINKELSSTQKQLSSVNKSLKLDPGNTELLEQKQKTLAKAVEETTKKIEALKSAQANLKESGAGAGNSQYDALTREISDTTVKLSQLKKEQSETSTELSRAQASSSAFAQGLQTVGSAASVVAEKTRMVSAAAAAALGAMAALAYNSAQTADEWLTLAQQTGLSTDAIQKFAYAAERIDVPLPTITQSVTNLKKHLDDTSGIWDQIGVKVRDQSGQYRNIEDIFNDTVRALGNIENETERDTVAMKLFGKSANELAGLIDDGGKKLRSLGQEAENMGVIVSEEDLEKLGHFNDLLDGMKAQLKGAAMQAAVPIMEAMIPIVEAVASAFQRLAKVLSALPSPVVTILAIILLLVAALSPVAMGISMVTSALSGLTTVLPAVGAAIGQLVSAATAAIAGNPYVGVILAIIVALAALAAAIYVVVTHWDEFSAAGKSAFNALTQPAQNIISVIKAVADGIMNSLGGIPGIIEKVASAFSSLTQAAQNVAAKVSTVFQSLQDKAFNIGSQVMGAFANGIKSAINQVTQAVQTLINTLSNMWSSITNDASRAGQRTGSAYADAYKRSTSTISSSPVTFNSSGGSMINTLSTSLASVINSATPSYASSSPVQVNVELVGSAKNIFDTVRVQNNRLVTATGYHALG